MAWQSYVTRRNTFLFGFAALASSYAAARYRVSVEDERKRKESNFFVTTARSGGGV